MDSHIKDLVTGWRDRTALPQPSHEEERARAQEVLRTTMPAKSIVQEYLDRRPADN